MDDIFHNEWLTDLGKKALEGFEDEETKLKKWVEDKDPGNKVERGFAWDQVVTDPAILSNIQTVCDEQAWEKFLDRYVEINAWQTNDLGQAITSKNVYFCSWFAVAVSNAIANAKGTSIYARSVGATRNLWSALEKALFDQISLTPNEFTPSNTFTTLPEGSMVTLQKRWSDYADFGSTHTVVKVGNKLMHLIGHTIYYTSCETIPKPELWEGYFYFADLSQYSFRAVEWSTIFRSKFDGAQEAATNYNKRKNFRITLKQDIPMSPITFAQRVADLCMCTTEYAMAQVIKQNNITYPLSTLYTWLSVDIIWFSNAEQKSLKDNTFENLAVEDLWFVKDQTTNIPIVQPSPPPTYEETPDLNPPKATGNPYKILFRKN